MPANGVFRDPTKAAAATDRASSKSAPLKQKRLNFVQPLKRNQIEASCALQVFDFEFFFFFFAMTLYLHATPREQQWPRRHEREMNRLWRSGFSGREGKSGPPPATLQLRLDAGGAMIPAHISASRAFNICFWHNAEITIARSSTTGRMSLAATSEKNWRCQFVAQREP
jgi:hypothetical protein